MIVVKPEGRQPEDVDGGLGGSTGGQLAFFLGAIEVKLDDLLQGAIGGLQFVDALVVDSCQQLVSLGS